MQPSPPPRLFGRGYSRSCSPETGKRGGRIMACLVRFSRAFDSVGGARPLRSETARQASWYCSKVRTKCTPIRAHWWASEALRLDQAQMLPVRGCNGVTRGEDIGGRTDAANDSKVALQSNACMTEALLENVTWAGGGFGCGGGGESGGRRTTDSDIQSKKSLGGSAGVPLL